MGEVTVWRSGPGWATSMISLVCHCGRRSVELAVFNLMIKTLRNLFLKDGISKPYANHQAIHFHVYQLFVKSLCRVDVN